jgi:hypothetical protein
MRHRADMERPETATAGIVIGIIDILAMLGVIAFLCTANFQF